MNYFYNLIKQLKSPVVEKVHADEIFDEYFNTFKWCFEAAFLITKHLSNTEKMEKTNGLFQR